MRMGPVLRGLVILVSSFPFSFAALAADRYVEVAPTVDGIGKVYMGREIAHVMGHEGADWLERSSRAQEEGTDRLVPLLGLRPTDTVADIGAGTGYFSFRMSKTVPQGKVYAEDVQPEMLAIIRMRQAKGEGANIITVLGDVADTKLPTGALDLILLVDAYHEFSYPREMGLSMVHALKPGGRIALVEYRGEDSDVPIKVLHKMTESQARKEMAALGLVWQHTDESLPWQHVMFFVKDGR
jgi:ubiquinone/menaquinone biosynthesis C-methylase UbiE